MYVQDESSYDFLSFCMRRQQSHQRCHPQCGGGMNVWGSRYTVTTVVSWGHLINSRHSRVVLRLYRCCTVSNGSMQLYFTV